MFSCNICRSVANGLCNVPRSVISVCMSSSSVFSEPTPVKIRASEQQADCYKAKDIEFCPNRNREVLQNYVTEASQSGCNEDPFVKGEKFVPAEPMSERDHLEAYKSGNSVSLYAVMQSNVPEPFSTRGKAPTHLNMPGGSCSQGYKYLSGQMQNTHQSKQ